MTGTPKYISIRNSILADIKNGKLVPGDKLPTRKQLLETYQVTRTTLDKALTELIRRGILKTSKRGGTYVSSVIPDPKIAVVSNLKRDILAGAQDENDELHFLRAMIRGGRGLRLDFHDSDFAVNNYKVLAEYDWTVWFQPSTGVIDKLRSKKLNVILVNRYFDDMNYVSTNHREAIHRITDLFIKYTENNGQLFYIKPAQRDDFISNERCEGFVDACEQSECFYRIMECHDHKYEKILEFMMQLPINPDKPLVIVTPGTMYTGAAIKMASLRGLKMYEDFFFSDFDNFHSMQTFGIQVTTVVQNYQRMGEILSESLRSGTLPIRHYVPYEIKTSLEF